MSSLLTPVNDLPGMRSDIAQKLEQLGLRTLRDALLYFPFRHEDFRQRKTIGQLAAGETVTLLVKIVRLSHGRGWRRKVSITEARVTDESRKSLYVVWYNQPFLHKTFKVGDTLYVSGKVEIKKGRWQMSSPAWERPSAEPTHEKLVPVYRSIEGLSQRQIRKVIKQAVALASLIPDPLPSEIQTGYHFLPKATALEEIHFPASPESGADAVRRLKFDELLAWQVFWQGETKFKREQRAEGWPFQEIAVRAFVQSLPFTLTTDQRVAAWQILQDVARPEPMSRLLQGDVGSGKTVVAALVAYNIMTQGGQVAFLTPTILLAEQHFKTFHTMLGSQDLTIAFLSGQRTTVVRQGQEIPVDDIPAAIQSGAIQCVIGTHALIQNGINFKRLGLVMVDEQQRFGVEQRDALLKQSPEQPDLVPHFLSLTATPIPRTLALFLAGDLSITTLKNRPAGHGKVSTEVLAAGQQAKIDGQIKAAVEAGHQAFIITPLIEESDALGVRSAISEFERLQRAMPGIRFGLVHGSLPAEERLATLEALRQGALDVIVGTTVLEVGIDIQNATLIVIEGAERFGLAQLHQLRGRVGRGLAPGHCILATDSAESSVHQRLEKVARITDGFQLAELDLSERGGGELYGVRQSGLADWQLASLSDTDLIMLARQVVVDQKIDQTAKDLLIEELHNTPGVRHRE